MKLYIVSEEQLHDLTRGGAHERENALTEVAEQQEVTVERGLKAVLSAEAARSKGGAE